MDVKQCDRCKTIFDNNCESYLHLNFRSIDKGFDSLSATGVDLCANCRKEFLSFLKENITKL